MKYAKCRFRPTDTRLYTYENPGLDLVAGDFVKVADNRVPTAWKRVEVVELTDEIPPFACKPILGIYNPDAEPTEGVVPAGDADPLAGPLAF